MVVLVQTIQKLITSFTFIITGRRKVKEGVQRGNDTLNRGTSIKETPKVPKVSRK